jgi:hypothetical protein
LSKRQFMLWIVFTQPFSVCSVITYKSNWQGSPDDKSHIIHYFTKQFSQIIFFNQSRLGGYAGGLFGGLAGLAVGAVAIILAIFGAIASTIGGLIGGVIAKYFDTCLKILPVAFQITQRAASAAILYPLSALGDFQSQHLNYGKCEENCLFCKKELSNLNIK